MGSSIDTSLDLVDRLAIVWREWRRDNGLWCRQELRDLLDEYPWSTEAAEFYGLVCAKTRHTQSDRAMVRLHEWMSLHQVVRGEPYQVDDGLERFKIMKDFLVEWLSNHRGTTLRARIVDIGGQMGEMATHWIGLPGVLDCTVIDIAMPNLSMGRRFYGNPRLSWAQALGHALPLRDCCMDVAILSGVLEHVRNPDALVDEAERVLVDGGIVLIQVPYGGMEGAPNPKADGLSFRSHVWCIDPRGYAMGEGRTIVFTRYLSYTGKVNLPHSMLGECGDQFLAYSVGKAA